MLETVRKVGGSGGSAERASCPTLSDCIVSFEGAVRDSGSNPQHHVRSAWRPAHLLTRAHPAMKQPLHRAFRRRRGCWLRVVTRRVVDDHCPLPGHVQSPRPRKSAPTLPAVARAADPTGGDGIERRQRLSPIDSSSRGTWPCQQAPTDVLHSIGEEGAVLPVSVRNVGPAFDCLGDMLDAHREMEPCVDGPSDAREKMRNLTGGSIAIMCPALSTRRHDRWPRWDPRSRPKHGCGFVSRCTKRVHWIVGSTDRHLILLFHPGINARFRRAPAVAGRL